MLRYIDLFAEEVVRGGPAFAVSLGLSALEPALRGAAELGAWQVISPVSALGRVAVVGGLHEVQDEVRPGCSSAPACHNSHGRSRVCGRHLQSSPGLTSLARRHDWRSVVAVAAQAVRSSAERRCRLQSIRAWQASAGRPVAHA